MFKISRQNLNFKCAVVHLYSYHRLTGLLGQATSAGKRGTLVWRKKRVKVWKITREQVIETHYWTSISLLENWYECPIYFYNDQIIACKKIIAGGWIMDINKNIYLIIKKNTFSRKIPVIIFDYFLRPWFSDVEFQMISRLFACVLF